MKYEVQRMTIMDYDRYMGGSNEYHVEYLRIEAESKEEAADKAEKEGYIVNRGYVKTLK